MRHYSGKFVLRVSAELHQQLEVQALNLGQSLNRLCADFLQAGVETAKNQPVWHKQVVSIRAKLSQKFRDQLLGVLIFGSQIDQSATEASDLDVLVILDRAVSLERKLYQWWDKSIPDRRSLVVSPHFVHLPDKAGEAGSLWFEVAMNHKIFFDRKNRVQKTIHEILGFIETGLAERNFSNGHPYWVMNQREVA